MPTTCQIKFENNPLRSIYSGDLLRGSVALSVTKEKNVRGVYIELCGNGHVSWTNGAGRYQKSYIDDETYLNDRIYFVGSGSSEEARLPMGTHNYSFEFNLPPSLPTSIENDNGYIRYVARVVLDISLWPSKTFVQPFTVIRPLDLNTIPTIRNPIRSEKTDTITGIDWLCWLYSDPLKISVRIQFGGYIPGQIIKAQINVGNQTVQPIRDITVKLVRKVTSFASLSGGRKQGKTETLTLTKINVGGCDKYQNKVIYANISVPQTPPTDVLSSKIIKICYVVRVIAMVSSYWCSDAILDVPVTIGTHPIHDDAAGNMPFFRNETPFASSDNVVSLEPLRSVDGDAPPYSPPAQTPPPFPNDDLPPSYAEAINLNPEHRNILKSKNLKFKHSTSHTNRS